MTLRQEQPLPEGHQTAIEVADATITVLLVDNDRTFASLVAEYLDEEYGFDVTIETNPKTALDRLSGDNSINCVVSDYAMPEMDGLEFLDLVKSQFPALPFVMFAGQGPEQVASRALQLGADDYLEKNTGETRYELLARRIESCVTITRQQQRLQDVYAAIEHAGHAMLVTDAEGTITYANPTMEDVSGYSVDELRGETPAIFKSGEHDQEFYRDLWGTVRSGEIWEGEVINEHKSGHQYTIDQTISPITNNGTITGFVAINRDVTVRKRRERTLAFFEQAIEQVGTGIAAYDAEGTIRYANEAYADMLGSAPGTLTGHSITELNPVFEADRFDEYWNSFAAGETRRQEGVNKRLDDGETFSVDTVTTHVAVGDDEYHVGTIQDITATKERERELKMFREAVEQAGHAVVVTDTAGQIEYVNPAFEELTGYNREEAIGETPAILKSGEHCQEFYQRLWGTILGGDVWKGEIANERKNGEQYVIDQTIAPLENDDDEITHFVAINRDITEIKEHERELKRQNERLERFGRTVAHDLRNPLNVMDAHLELAQEAEDPDTAHTEIQQAIDRMTELIDELLALAKQGKTVLDPEPASLEDVATTAWKHVDTKIMQLEVTEDRLLLMDDSRVCEVFENIFRNAREHAGADAALCVGPLSDGFYIEDDGPGIPPNERTDVLKSGFTTSKDGTGFGLAIVSQIADAHDWTVTVTESPAGGARFEFHGVERE